VRPDGAAPKHREDATVKTKRKITYEQVMAAIGADENLGFCIACGNEQGGCEPDARGYECEDCGARKVYGAEELLLMGYAS
jgi:hypothetical protein